MQDKTYTNVMTRQGDVVFLRDRVCLSRIRKREAAVRQECGVVVITGRPSPAVVQHNGHEWWSPTNLQHEYPHSLPKLHI